MLAAELEKPEYTGLTHAACLELLRSRVTPTVGSIRGAQLKFLQVFISSVNLRARLAAATAGQVPVAAALAEAIQPAYLAAESTFSINLADPNVAGMLNAAVAVGLITDDERAQLVSMATFDKPDFPDVTLSDVIAVRAPDLMATGAFTELLGPVTSRLLLRLQADLPEPDNVRVEMRESHNGEDWAHWVRVAHFTAVHSAGNYYQAIPSNGLQRQIRWRGERYVIEGVVESV